MKRILIFVLTIVFCLTPTAPAFPADELIYETFDSWKNPYVAEGWETYSVGGWGGEYNQIYEAGQFLSWSCRPATPPFDRPMPENYRSIYRDFRAEAGKNYSLSADFPADVNTKSGLVWLQFDDKDGNVISTYGPKSEGPWGSWRLPAGIAPQGTHHLRVVIQAKWTMVIKGLILYEDGVTIDGPFFNRNTEYDKSGIAREWFPYIQEPAVGYRYEVGGEYKLWPVGGSSQGISCGGTFADFKSLYRDLRVTPGQRYKLSVDVISNSTNENGTRTPSPVRIWIQYDDKDGRVLSTHGIDGTQAGIKMDEWTTVTVPGPGGTPYTIAPAGTDHARIILQVMGGTGGGTIFDNVSFTRYES